MDMTPAPNMTGCHGFAATDVDIVVSLDHSAVGCMLNEWKMFIIVIHIRNHYSLWKLLRHAP